MIEIKKIDDIIGILMTWEPRTARGHYLNLVLELWQTADPENKEMLQEFISKTIVKFKLDVAYENILAKIPQAKKMSDQFLGV